MTSQPRYVEVARVAEIPPGTSLTVHIDDDAIAIFNVDGAFHAIDNRCPHANAPLADGELDGNLIACPLHGWQFDVTNGDCHFMPAARVHCYAVKVEGQAVLVEVGTRPY